jgi:hypothetical protein
MLKLLSTKIKTPLIYKKDIATVDTQRTVTSDTNKCVIQLHHVYYGKIGILA